MERRIQNYCNSLCALVVAHASEGERVVAIRADADRPLLHRHTAVKRCCVVRAEGEDIIECVCHYRCDVDRDVTQVVRCFHATDSAGKRVHRNACNCYLLADFIVRDGRQNQRAL